MVHTGLAAIRKRVAKIERRAQPAAPLFDPAQWTVRRYTEGGGIVHFEGDPPFSCRFSKVEDYDYENWGQDMAYSDEQSGLIFFDFAWREGEAGTERLVQLVTDMRRAVRLAPQAP